MIAKAVAAETNAYFFTINGPEIMSKVRSLPTHPPTHPPTHLPTCPFSKESNEMLLSLPPPTHPPTHPPNNRCQASPSPSSARLLNTQKGRTPHPPTRAPQHLIRTASSPSIFSTIHPTSPNNRCRASPNPSSARLLKTPRRTLPLFSLSTSSMPLPPSETRPVARYVPFPPTHPPIIFLPIPFL